MNARDTENRVAPSYPKAVARKFSNTYQDNSVNKALPWVAISWFLSGGAVLGLVLMALMVPQLIDSRVNAAIAEVNATANTARQDARIALDKVEQTQVQLGAKGIVFPSTH